MLSALAALRGASRLLATARLATSRSLASASSSDE
jgi:hypothetical protein